MSTVQQPHTIDILSLIEQRAPTRLIRKASTDGGEYWGNCPWCGGTDRFHAWPHSAKPHYWCRHCERKGDAIQFLIEWEGRSFREACEELGIDAQSTAYKGTDSPLSASPVPCDKWMEAANDFIYAAKKALWKTAYGQQYLQYLYSRGINDEMIYTHNIGCVPLKDGRWIETPFERWGLTSDMLTPAQLSKGCIRIPDGLLFPYYVDGKPWKLSMKRPFVQAGEMKRGQIIGSKECLFNESLISQDKPVIMTEAYLDALSIEQVAGDLVVAVSTDGTSNSRSLRIQAKLGYAPYVLQAFDNDIPGEEAATWWSQHLKKCMRWSPDPIDGVKDVNEMLWKNVDVRLWVKEGMEEFVLPRETTSLHIVKSEPDEPEEEPMDTCILCPAEAENYTPQGNPCCAKHYGGQVIIEQALQEYAQSVVTKVPSVDPLTAFTAVVNRIQSLFGPCAIHYDPPGYTLSDHVAFLNDKHRREEIVKEATMRQKKRDYEYNKLQTSLQE